MSDEAEAKTYTPGSQLYALERVVGAALRALARFRHAHSARVRREADCMEATACSLYFLAEEQTALAASVEAEIACRQAEADRLNRLRALYARQSMDARDHARTLRGQE